MNQTNVVAAIIKEKNRYLIVQRNRKKHLGLKWEFPGGKVDINESNEEALQREIKEELNIIIDLSHLNEKGFWDVARISTNPLVATHSNVHEICPHSRNLTNKQLEAIKNSDGIVGLNLATAFLRTDGKMEEDTNLEIILRHFDHLINILGEDKVAIGSDFDGAKVPLKIKNLVGMNVLKEFLLNKGYNKNLIIKLFSENWLNFLYKHY